ncbi:MAG: type IV secretion system DNA-binding domain-containing protein [bacterium]|nr:type IV secretion system DNA-binding domain-containing protein [bacterium]
MIGFFQFTISPDFSTTPTGFFSNPVFFMFFLLVVIGLVIFGGLFLLRAFIKNSDKENKAFERTLIQVLVPKERKSEGQGGQISQDDRLEQVREEIAITETFFSSVAGLRAQSGFKNWIKGRTDHFSFEIVAHNNLIYFYIDSPKKMNTMIEQQIHAQYPYAEIEEITDYNIFSESSKIVGAYLTTKQSGVFPIKTYKTMDSDPLSGVLNSLSKIYENNSSAAIQFVVQSTHRRWRRKGVKLVREVRQGKKFESVVHSNWVGKFFSIIGENILGNKKKEGQLGESKYQLSQKEEEMIKGIEDKLSKGGVEVNIRLLSVSDDENLARENLHNLVNSFSQYNLYRYGNSFEANIPRTQSAIIRDFIYRSYIDKNRVILNTEEIAGLWHLPLRSTEAPSVKWLGARKAPPPSNMGKDGLLLGHSMYRGIDVPIYMKDADRRRHLYTIGKSGTGKSNFLINLAIQDIQNGKGMCIIDPHGDFVEVVLGHIPKNRVDDVIIFNPSDTSRPIGLNMLEAKSEDQKDFAVQEMISIFYKLFPPEMIGPMFEHQMRNVMLTLMADINDTGTIIDIPRMFTDDEYVKKYLKKLKDPVVRAFWEKEMAKTSDFHKSEMLGYLVSKVGRFVENEMMRNIMGQQKSGFNFRDVMDNEKILLVNLAKGTTGEVNAKLLGLIIVAKLQMAAMGRSDIPEDERKDFYLYIDEFQNFVTDSISTILSEARKYKLDLIIAHQYMGQLIDDKGKSEIKDAVLGNAGTICSFRIGPEDADILAKEFAPTFSAYDLINVPQYTCYTKLLIDNTASRPFNMMVYPPQKGNKELAKAIKELSRLKYGRDQNMVETEILERTQLGIAASKANPVATEPSL